MRTFGIVGHPVGHSLSPAMQGAALRAAGLDAEYVPFDVGPQHLEEAARGLRLVPVAGINVTLPHKEAILPLLDEVSGDARRIGAVNTVVVRAGRWRGENTDAPALARVLPRVAEAVVLGAGGAARAALFAIASRGPARVWVVNRTVSRARRLAAEASGWGLDCRALPLERAALAPAFEGASLVVGAWSAAALGAAEDALRALPIDALPRASTVVDLAYFPRPTPLCERAAARGLQAADGTEMLLEQGALSFSLWTGIDAPRQVMREALERGLR